MTSLILALIITAPVQPVITVIPWMELNAPTAPLARFYPDLAADRPTQTMTDYCLAGMTHWASVTDTVVISTRQSGAAVYVELMRRKPPGLRLIPGLKTFDYLDGYADQDGWARLAADSVSVARATDGNKIILDSEVALGPYHRGEVAIDLAALYAALQPLADTGLDILWYQPEILYDDPRFPNRRQETARLVRTIADSVPRSTFSTGFTAWHDWEDNGTGQVDRREEMIDLVGLDCVQERLIVTDDGWMALSRGPKRCHTPPEALALMRRLPGHTFIVYPGGARWESTAIAFANCRPPDPIVLRATAVLFSHCLSGPGEKPPGGCLLVDIDNDNDVDLADWAQCRRTVDP